MQAHHPTAASLVLTLLTASCNGAASRPATPAPASTAASAAASATASVFAPGIISGPGNDAAVAFTPDGETLYVTRQHTILVSHRRGDTWSEPEVAPFSGRWGDAEPAIAPDGSFLIFASNRPAALPKGDVSFGKRELLRGRRNRRSALENGLREAT